MPSDLKELTALVCTHGLFVSQAARLARDLGKVYLYTPGAQATSFPAMNIGNIGYGLPGVERVDSIFGEHFDDVDLFVFPDIYFADEQEYLESIGKNVWGSRRGEELELYRELAKQEMERLGLPVQPWKKLTGIEALRSHLKANENQFVKINRWRGNFETFKSVNYELSEVKLDEIEHTLGGFKDIVEFVCEDELTDCVEAGLDIYCIDGKYPAATLVGIEVKDLGYVGQFKQWDAIPEPLRRWHEKMGPTLAKYNYRGWLSNEIRIGKDLEPYMIDATCRTPSPPGELLQEFHINFSEIIWEGAQGNVVDPKPAGKFGVQVLLKSAWAEKNWQPVEYPEEFAPQIKLFNAVDIDGKHYVVPQDEELQEIGAVIGWGDTLESAVDHMQEAADSIEGFGIQIPMGSIDKAKEQMEELAALGLPVFTLEGAKSTPRTPAPPKPKPTRPPLPPPPKPKSRRLKIEGVERDPLTHRITGAKVSMED